MLGVSGREFEVHTGVMSWDSMVMAVSKAPSDVEAWELAWQAKGYVRCLDEVGVISVFQRARMEADLQRVCSLRLEKTSSRPPLRS